MSGGRDEVEARVDAGVVVAGEEALHLQLLLEVHLELRVDVVHDHLCTKPNRIMAGLAKALVPLVFVELVAEAGGLDHAQLHAHAALHDL